MGLEDGYLLHSYVLLCLLAIRRMRIARKDLSSFLFIFAAPLLYILEYKGELKTPIGRLLVSDRAILRSFTYGFLKTRFAYQYSLRTHLPQISFFPIVVDVGANIGDFTLAMRDLAGKIVAVEPAEENFSALSTNIGINDIDNAIPVRLAAHDQEEEIFLQGESSNMYVAEGKRGQSVKGMPLDLIVRRLGFESVDLMKIDVQGHEIPVLSGMHYLLKGKFVKFLILEVHLKRGVSVDKIIYLMKLYGYRLIHKDPYLFGQPHLYFAA